MNTGNVKIPLLSLDSGYNCAYVANVNRNTNPSSVQPTSRLSFRASNQISPIPTRGSAQETATGDHGSVSRQLGRLVSTRRRPVVERNAQICLGANECPKKAPRIADGASSTMRERNRRNAPLRIRTKIAADNTTAGVLRFLDTASHVTTATIGGLMKTELNENG